MSRGSVYNDPTSEFGMLENVAGSLGKAALNTAGTMASQELSTAGTWAGQELSAAGTWAGQELSAAGKWAGQEVSALGTSLVGAYNELGDATLPAWLLRGLALAGIQWPRVTRTQVLEFARLVAAFGDAIQSVHGDATQVVYGIPQVFEAAPTLTAGRPNSFVESMKLKL